MMRNALLITAILLPSDLVIADHPHTTNWLQKHQAAHIEAIVEHVIYRADAQADSMRDHLDLQLTAPSEHISFNLGMLQDDATLPSSTPASQTAPPSTGSTADELSKKLANPISSLISVPFQNNFIFGAGPDGDGFQYRLNVQPVIPISLNDDWNLIIRTIVPIIYQDDIILDGNWSQFGLGDTTQSFFFSPKQPTSGGLIWGVGPVFLWPTATNDSLGSQKWGIGPTGVVLVQKGPWTYGALANHIFSYAGEDHRADINATFLQPFLTYQLGNGWSVGGNAEMTYDWEAEQWTIPLFANVQRVFNLGGQMMSLQVGPQWFVESPPNGPEWAFRINLTLLFPTS